MKYFDNIKNIRSDYKVSEIVKSIVLGLIFFIIALVLIVVLTVNISFIYVRYVTEFVIVADLIGSLTAFFSVKLVYMTLLNYNNEPTINLKYIIKVDLVLIPIIVFLLGLIPLLYI